MWARWLLAGLVLASTGCQLHVQVSTAFDRDGGGQLTVAVTADADLRERAREAGAAPLDDLAAAGDQLAGGWRVEDATGGDGRRTVALSTDFDGPEAFATLTRDLAGALAAPELELLAPFTVAVSEDRIEVEGAAGLQPTDAVAELGLTADQAVALLADQDGLSYEVRVAMPGEVLRTTADRRDDGTLVWTVPAGEQVTISAVGERPGRPLWPLATAAGLGAAAAGLLLLGLRRRP